MKIFITGATGYLGKEFIKYYKNKFTQVYLLTRKKINIKDKNIKILKSSISKNWSKEMRDSEVLIHFAAAGVSDKKISYKKAYKFNVTESLKLFNNAYKNNLKKWIVIGSSSEYGSTIKKKLDIKTKPLPKCNYGKTKYIFSKKIINFSKKKKCLCKILRVFPVYGLDESKNRLYPSLMRSIKYSKNFVLKNGNQLNDYSKVESVIKKIYQCAKFKKTRKKYPQKWHIASGNSVLLSEFVKKIWKKNSAKGKLTIIPQTSKNLVHHVSNIKSIW